MTLLRSILFLLAFAVSGSAATYYVDPASSDTNNGTSMATAFLHCPGDSGATDTAAATTLQSGDTVMFKGGVIHRGQYITMESGVTYQGTSAWGTGKAILDGSTLVSTSWTACTNAGDAWGNPYYTNIYWTTIPAGVSNCLPTMFANGTNLCQWSQEPDPSDPIFWEVLSEWRAVSTNDNATEWIHDAINLTETNGYYNECWLATWVYGNQTIVRPVTNYFQSTNTIWFNEGETPYTDRDSAYSLINHPAFIDTAGEWAVRTNENRVYLWTPGSADPNTLEVSIAVRGSAFAASNKSNITVTGFSVRGYYQPPLEAGYTGQFIITSSSDFENHSITVSSNEIYFMRSFNQGPTIQCDKGSNISVERNYIHDNMISRGILVNGATNASVSYNDIYRMNGTGIWLNGATNSTLSGNSVRNLIGVHGNGMSVYGYCTNVLISANAVSNCVSLITYEYCSDLTFVNNVVDANGNDYRINDWQGTWGPVRWFNNTLVNNPNGSMLLFSTPGSGASYLLQNNIISGGGGLKTQGDNIYTALIGYQTLAMMTNGNIYTNAGSVFVNTNTHNWHLSATSPAISAGTNLNSVFVTDYAGMLRGSIWDIGAYAYEAGAPVTTISALSAVTNLRIK